MTTPHFGKPPSRVTQPGGAHERGQVAILFALMAVVLVAGVGLALDAGLGYMNRTTLQGAADTASQTGATILAADFRAGSVTSPFDYTQFQGYVQTDLEYTTGGPTKAHAFSGFLVTSTSQTSLCIPTGSLPLTIPAPPSNQCIVCQFYPASTSTGTVPACTSIPSTSSGGPAVNAVEVVPTNANSTPLLGVVGINSSSQSADAITAFNLVNGVPNPPYTVWYDCYSPTDSPWSPSKGQPQPGSLVQYYNNAGGSGGYQQNAACGDPNDTNASFKGNLSNVQPSTATVPGWINAQSGTNAGQLVGIPKGTKFLLPYVDCLGKARDFPFASCALSANLPSQCGPTFTPGTPDYEWDLCVVGYVYVKAVNACNEGGAGGVSEPCIAEVIQDQSTTPPVTLCDPTAIGPYPSCGNLYGGSQNQPIIVTLDK